MSECEVPSHVAAMLGGLLGQKLEWIGLPRSQDTTWKRYLGLPLILYRCYVDSYHHFLSAQSLFIRTRFDVWSITTINGTLVAAETAS